MFIIIKQKKKNQTSVFPENDNQCILNKNFLGKKHFYTNLAASIIENKILDMSNTNLCININQKHHFISYLKLFIITHIYLSKVLRLDLNNIHKLLKRNNAKGYILI